MNYLIIVLAIALLTGCGSKSDQSTEPPIVGTDPCVDCLPDDQPMGRITKADYTLNDLWQENFLISDIAHTHPSRIHNQDFTISRFQNDDYTRGFHLKNVYCQDIATTRVFVGFDEQNIKSSSKILRITGNTFELFSYTTTINSNPSAYGVINKEFEETWECVDGLLFKSGDPNFGNANSEWLGRIRGFLK